MRRLISLLITLPLLAVGVVFALNNNHLAFLDLWPLEARVGVPLWALLLAALFLGFLLGGCAMWLSGGAGRQRARAEHRHAQELQREVSRLKQTPPAGQALSTAARGG